MSSGMKPLRLSEEPAECFITPVCDGIMKKLGWKKYGNVPIFWKRRRDNKAYPYFAIVPTDHQSYYCQYEKWYNEGKLTLENLEKFLKGIDALTTNSFIRKGIFKPAMYRLASDFYYHNGGEEKMKYWEDKLENYLDTHKLGKNEGAKIT